MHSYLLKRLASVVPTLLVVSLVVFALMRMIPGDPAQLMSADAENQQARAELREELGLDRSLPVQYALWLKSVLRGDLGQSITTREPVAQALVSRFSVTAQVTLAATLLAALVAVPAGMLAAWRQDRLLDVGIVTASVVLLSLPGFWIGILLIMVFGVWLEWLPFVGYVSVREGGWEGLKYLLLPVAALVLTEIATIARIARASTIEVLRLEYIASARAKGLPERTVLARHAFPNAFAPTLSFLGIVLGSLLGGAAVTETVFTLPGLGRLLIDAIYARDYPVVQGCLLVITMIFVAVNLLVDLMYPLFDPRVKL